MEKGGNRTRSCPLELKELLELLLLEYEQLGAVLAQLFYFCFDVFTRLQRALHKSQRRICDTAESTGSQHAIRRHIPGGRTRAKKQTTTAPDVRRRRCVFDV